MSAQVFAQVLGVSVDEIERLLALSPAEIYEDAGYKALVDQMDEARLTSTAQHARDAYDHSLEPVKAKYGLSDTVMSGHTLVNWVLGFLSYPGRMRDMLVRHMNISVETVEAALPELLNLLDDLPEGGPEWQYALVTFSLPLVAR